MNIIHSRKIIPEHFVFSHMVEPLNEHYNGDSDVLSPINHAVDLYKSKLFNVVQHFTIFRPCCSIIILAFVYFPVNTHIVTWPSYPC